MKRFLIQRDMDGIGGATRNDLNNAGKGSEEVLEAMEQAFLMSDSTWKLGRRLMVALRAGEAAGGDRRAQAATPAALLISGDVAFPLLDLRVDFHDHAVQELTEIYERSQDLWIQQWRDEMVELPILNRLVA